MTKDNNAVLFYLCGKNYFNGTIQIQNALGSEIDVQPALDEIEALSLLQTKTDEHNRKVYLLKQFAKDGIHNIPHPFSQDPYAYFKQSQEEKRRIIAQHVDYVENLENEKDADEKAKRVKKRNKVIGIVLGSIASLIAFAKLKRK